MSDILQELLEHLHSILQQNIQGRGIEASRIVQDVVTHCLDSVTASEIGEMSKGRFITASVLFD